VTVAGHACWRLEVRRATPMTERGVRYELDVEPETGLVVAWREFGGDGALHSDVGYVQLELDADLSGELGEMNLRARDLVATDLDPHADLTGQVGAEVGRPSLPPPGFHLEEVEHLSPMASEEWVKFVYTDGFERAFFLQRLDRGPSSRAQRHDFVAHAPLGPWRFAVGDTRGRSVIAAGKVPAQYLGELIQSSNR
jgi:hypothetical protein